MILAKSNKSIVESTGSIVTKKFNCPLMFMKEMFVYDNFPELTIPLLSVNDETKTISMPKLLTWREIINTLTPEQKKSIAIKLITKLKRLWEQGYVHGDVHMDNVVLDSIEGDYNPYLIDFEWFHCRINDHFEDDIDMAGFHSVHCFDGSYRSIKSVLGLQKEEVMGLIQ